MSYQRLAFSCQPRAFILHLSEFSEFIIIIIAHSYLSATIGSTLVARRAGM